MIGDYFMGDTLVRMEGTQQLILEKLVKRGYFKTKSEAIRAGVLELGKEYGILKNAREIEDELVVRKMMKISQEIREGKRKTFTLEQVKKKYGWK